MTRRTLVGGLALLAAGLAGCGTEQRRRWAGRYLTVATTGGALRQALYSAAFDPFRRATGCTVQDLSLSARDITRELRRQHLSGRVQWDLVVLNAPHAALAAHEMPNLFMAEEPLPFALDTLALAYRNGPFGDRVPTSWAEVWSESIPGVRLWPRDPVGLLEVALLADGVSQELLYPLDLDRAFASLDRFLALNPAWWQLSKEAGDALMLGKADLLLCYGGELRLAIDSGADAAVAALPSPLLPLTLNLPQGSPNGDVARDFATYLRGDAAQDALNEQGYGAAGVSAPSGVVLDVGWWRETGGEAFARFEHWFAAQ